MTRKAITETDEQHSPVEEDTTPQEQVGTPSDKLSQGVPGVPAAGPEHEDVEHDLGTRLAEAEAKRDEYLELAQRVQADFENYRKRAARDQERLVAHAHERLVKELLPVLDDLERALEAAERHEEAKLVDGVRLVERLLRKALEKEGLREIETDGEFDPHVHEALLTQAREGAEPGSVVDVVQRGYRIGDKVVRPARVIVAE
jgi:molecular chaperone GrpE